MFTRSRKIIVLTHRICRQKTFFWRQENNKMNEQNIENKIRYIIDRKKHGVILFAGDFADMGERKTINKAFHIAVKCV